MLQSEKRSLIRFLMIYLASTFLLFSLAAWIFYTSTRHHLIDKQRDVLKFEAKQMLGTLRMLHQSDTPVLYYPDNPVVQSAIYDLDKQWIFGSYKGVLSSTEHNGTLIHIEKVDPYYLGAAYLLTTKKLDSAPIAALQRHIILFMLVAGLFFAILGYFLGKLFIAPMRHAIEQMNRFIQDTTHELNTPISTILTNIEMIETFDKCHSADEELKRIDIASRTLSRIYDDLSYLNLNHHYHRKVTRVDMSRLSEERLLYFQGMAEAKHISIETECIPGIVLMMDRNDAVRLIDNLLSNAIKYNKPSGTLRIELNKTHLSVTDTGIGIAPEDMKSIIGRFNRANSSEGGFGIGLDIVDQVVRYYGFGLHIDSKINEGTTVRITW